ncbi:DNA-binding response regulator [Aquimarina sp. D1M17]|uniref:DNA-binding response regulator n=1 Tax=Aquimarina acroporae TaxID=2937283 RepID=UPI0020BDA966|nr:DNA-binding response regulator [Aquimarina acroporae]MCK8520154.1 DNA-binding response regulator [Aquimarina acroporae]
MFTKVLVAEDYEIANQGIIKVLNEELGIQDLHESKYCDDAYLKFRKAYQDNNPFQLLITDLSFKEDHKIQVRTSGIDLIKDVKSIQSNIKVIVYSQEDRPDKINMLFEKLSINGYVCKGQNAIKELLACLHGVFQDQIVFPPVLTQQSESGGMVHLDDLDMMLLEELAKGYTKKEIRLKLIQLNITPNGESSIDKRVSRLFDSFQAKNTTHLIAIVKDLGLL